MGCEHVKDGIITITQQKTGEVVDIPILPALQTVLDNAQRRRITPTFIVTEYGQPFSEAGFTNKFRDWCKAAGLPKGLTPHGLRKAFCRVAAEAGLTPHQIMSISGHRTLTEVTRYTAAVDRRKLAIDGMQKIERVRGVETPINRFPLATLNPLKAKKNIRRMVEPTTTYIMS